MVEKCLAEAQAPMTVAAMFYVRVLSFAQAFCWKRCHHKPTKELLPGEVSQDNGCY